MICAGAYARYVEPFWFEVVEKQMPIANLPAALVGKRMLQLSDLHVGRTDDDYLIEALRYANSLRPDFVVITGDFTSHRAPSRAKHVEQILKHLQPAPMGSFACLGNHDYGAGWSDIRCAEAITNVVEACGVRVLRNEIATTATGLSFAGIDDYWSPNFNARELTRQIDRSAATITLCHNPDVCDAPVWNNFKGWILAGHTHGGQCKPPFLPPPLLPVRNRNYVAGEYAFDDGRRLYINRALGWGRQARFNVRPEMTVFTLSLAAS